MRIDDELIRYLETLSKLSLDDAAREKAKIDLSRILDYMEKINELNPCSKETGVSADACDASRCVFRDDVTEPSFDREALLSNAPARNSEYFIVPKTVEI